MVGTAERNINKLRANFIAGLDQAKRDLPIWKDFVGL